MQPRPISIHDIEARHVHEATGLQVDPNPNKRSPWEKVLVQTWGRGDRGEWSVDLGLCKGCGRDIDTQPFTATFGETRVSIPCTVCEDCMESVREHYNAAREQSDDDATATPKWDLNCPIRHKQVALGEVKPDRVDWQAFERVRQWRPCDGRGLVMTGPAGTGKTSAFWALARDLERDQHNPITIGSLELARVLAEAARDIREVGWLYRCHVLLVDDLGKERASPAVAALLWEVLDRRLAASLPVIFTTNFSGEELAGRFGEKHLGDSIRRRISELCRQVQFQSKTP